jgi:hypothetical protein
MLASISPLGERARGNHWGRTVAWYVTGSLAGGLVTGGVAGALGAGLTAAATPDAATRAGLVILASIVALVLELGAFGARLPSNHRQVDETWLTRYRPWVYGGGFGFQLGLGVVTIVTTATLYLTIVLAVLSGSFASGLVIGATFGLARAVPILLVHRAGDPGTLRGVVRGVHSQGRAARRVALGALVTLVMLAVAAGAS